MGSRWHEKSWGKPANAIMSVELVRTRPKGAFYRTQQPKLAWEKLLLLHEYNLIVGTESLFLSQAFSIDNKGHSKKIINILETLPGPGCEPSGENCERS